jgi:hypothetical protein
MRKQIRNKLLLFLLKRFRDEFIDESFGTTGSLIVDCCTAIIEYLGD